MGKDNEVVKEHHEVEWILYYINKGIYDAIKAYKKYFNPQPFSEIFTNPNKSGTMADFEAWEREHNKLTHEQKAYAIHNYANLHRERKDMDFIKIDFEGSGKD